MSHSQTIIIAQREYFQRLKSRSFIITTALGPILLLLLVAVPVIMAIFANNETSREISVVDESGQLAPLLQLPDTYTIDDRSLPIDSLRAMVNRGELSGYLVLPSSLIDGDGEATFYSKGGGGIVAGEALRDAVTSAVRERRILDTGADANVVDITRSRVPLRMRQITEEGDRTDATPVLAAFGYMMGFLIYICMILYGAMVMRGVIEEKTNRISELIASSARPFQLLLGKIVGIGALGLTQILIWIAAGIVLSVAGTTIIASMVDLPDPTSMQASQEQVEAASAITEYIPSIPPSYLIYFVLFFVGGYLFYASLMAAVGSAVEQESDAQQFMWPIIMPLIIPMVLLAQIVSNPDGGLAVAMSLIPLFSPIIMVVRMAATNVPHWQVLLALVLLFGAFMGAVWLSSRIYRIGILSYGKKPSFAEIGRWIRTK